MNRDETASIAPSMFSRTIVGRLELDWAFAVGGVEANESPQSPASTNIAAGNNLRALTTDLFERLGTVQLRWRMLPNHLAKKLTTTEKLSQYGAIV